MIKPLLKLILLYSVCIGVSLQLNAQDSTSIFQNRENDSLFRARKALWLMLSPEIAHVMSDGTSSSVQVLH